MIGKFMVFKSLRWEKDARGAKWFMPAQQELGRGGTEMPPCIRFSERRQILLRPMSGRQGGEARLSSAS